jgi:hypothetical protein
MRGVAKIVFINGTIGDAKLAQKATFNKQTKGSVNGRTAHTGIGAVQLGHQFISIEMLMGAEYMLNQGTPRGGEFFATNLQKFTKLHFSRLSTGWGCQVWLGLRFFGRWGADLAGFQGISEGQLQVLGRNHLLPNLYTIYD